MNIRPDNCWCCEGPLHGCVVRCNRCNKAVYCSNLCQKRDLVRHVAVGCLRTKSCNFCKKDGNHKQCAGCSMAWYCDVSCQKKDYSDHKAQCKDIKVFIADLAMQMTEKYTALAQQVDARIPMGPATNIPYYFGTTIACDFLQLAENEWVDSSIGREGLARDFHVLSTGCGDLRNTLLTAASLPAEYQRKLHITLNDFDPSVMARNVLFLFMLIHEEGESLASSLATIWYSLHISEKDYKLIQRNLQDLLEINAERFQELVSGLVIISDADLDKIRDVWKRWYSLSCQRIKSSSINLSQQRREWFKQQIPEFFHYIQVLYPEPLAEMEAVSIGHWFEHGLFLPAEAKESDPPYNNPTLTGHVLEASTVRDGLFGTKTERKFVFQYSVDPTQTPFQAWDCNQVKQHAHTSNSSVTGMYHAYVADLLQKTKALFTQGRLLIHLLVSSFLDVPNTHKTLGMVDYDRIFTSSLGDSIGIRKLLQTFRPLLNAHNINAVIVTETEHWNEQIPKAYWTHVDPISSMFTEELLTSVKMNYQNTSKWFTVYLRAVMMAGGLDIPMLKDVPYFKQAMQVEGFRKRDFNKVIPFQHHASAKWLSQPTYHYRALEWYIPQADD